MSENYKNQMDEHGKFSKEYFEGHTFKQITVYVNESQKNPLVQFLDSIKFYGYSIVKDVETSWATRMRHRNSHAWPGADCIFYITVREDKVNYILSELKRHRMSLAENIIFAVGILPVETVIPDLYQFDIE